MAASDFFSSVPPELLSRVLRTGQLGDEETALRQRMARAQSRQQQATPRYTNPLAAALGGLAGAANAGIGAYEEMQAQNGLAALGKERIAGRQALADAYTGGMKRQDLTAPDVVAPSLWAADATPEQQELAENLRAKQRQEGEAGVRQGTAYLGLLSGDPVQRDFGNSLLSEDARNQRQELLAQRQELGQEGLALRKESLLRRAMDMEQARKDREARDAAQRKFQAEQNALSRASQERAAALSAGQRNAATTEAQTKEFGEEILKTGAPGFYERYDAATRILDRNKGDLPGFGRLEGRLPDDLISEEGRTLRQSIGQLLSEYRKGQTGAGMSDSERVEYGRITGLLQTGDEQSVRQGVEALKRAIDAKVRATAGGFRPEAVKTYAERVPRVGAALALPKDASGQPTLETAPPATAPLAPSGAPAVLMLPDGRRVRRNADGTYSPE